MKALKKFSAIVIALAMVMSCAVCNVVFAADNFNDVAEDNLYYKAIGDLVDKGIINGYDNGDGTYSFKPDGNITRAEFCAIIARADAPDGFTFTAANSSFNDVAGVADWAIGYIEYAVRRGIVNGMGDGRFAPNDPVTYAQALKMIVCTLNYGFAAEQTTPWYQTYITIANQLNLTKNAMALPDAAAIRGLVAQLIYNMNNTAPAVQTGTDKNGNPIYESGGSSYETGVKGTETVEGQLIGVHDKTITGVDEGLSKKQALVKLKSKEEVFVLGNYTLDQITEYLGYEVKISYSEDDAGKYVIERINKTSDNETYVVEDVDIIDISSSGMEYYTEDGEEIELEFASDMKVLVNGGYINEDIDDAIADAVEKGSITFIDCDGNGRMDVAFIKSYEVMFVGQVTSSNGIYKVYDKFAPSAEPLVFDEDSKKLTIKVAANGSNSLTEGTLKNITASSVVSVATSTTDADSKEIIISRKTASGSSSASKVSSLSSNYRKIVFGNKTFKTSKYYRDNVERCKNGELTSYPQELSVGDSCPVYLDFAGKIVAVDKKDAVSPYGYITSIGLPTGSSMDDKTVYVSMYDANGKFYSKLQVAENVKINGVKADHPADLIEAIDSSASNVNAGKDSGKIVNADKAVLVKYEISGNTLKSVYTVGGSSDDAIQPEFIIGSQALKYKSSNNSFEDSDGNKKFTITTKTKVFVVPDDRQNKDYRVSTGTGYFTNNNTYVIDAFDISGNSVKAVVVYGVTKVIKAGTSAILVENVFDTEDENGMPIQGLTYYKIGNDTVEEEPYYSMESNTFDGVEAGDVIRVLMNGEKVDKIQHIYSVEDGLITEDVIEDGGSYSSSTGILKQTTGSKDFEAMYGIVTVRPGEGRGEDKVYVSVDGTSEKEQAFKLANDTVIIKYVGEERNLFDFAVTTGDIQDIAPDASKVLIVRYDESTAKFIIIYDLDN